MIPEIRSILSRRKWLIILPMVIVFLVPSTVTWLTTKSFVAEGTLEVEPNDVLSPVVDEIEKDNELDAPIKPTEDLARALLVSNSFVADVAIKAGLGAELRVRRDATIGELKKGHEVFPVGPRRLVVRFRSPDAARSEAVAKATLELILTERRLRSKKEGDAAIAFFDAQVAQYQDELRAKEAELESFRTAHPEVELSQERENILNKLGVLRAELGQVRLRIDAGDGDLTTLTQREAVLLRQIDEASVPIGATPSVELTLFRLQASYDDARASMTRAVEQGNDARLLQRVTLYRVTQDRIVDVPTRPTQPSRGKALTLALLAFVVAIALAGGLVVLAEHLDPSVRREADVLRTTGIPVLAVVRQA